MQKVKSSQWQMVRAILCIAVVLIHCNNDSGLNLWDSNSTYYLVFRNLINFPVAAFFFVSGYFDNYENTRGGVHTYYLKRVKKLLIPYLFYSFLYIFADVVLGSPVSIQRILKNLIIGSAATPLYYCIVLLEFTLLAPLLHRLKRKAGVYRFIPLFTTIVIMLSGYLLMACTGINAWRYIKITPIWIVFFYTGILTRTYEDHVSNILAKKSTVLLICVGIVVTFLLEILETILWIKFDGYGFAYSQMRISGFLFAGFICALVAKLMFRETQVRPNRVLVKVGDLSLGIYFIHYAFVLLFNRLFVAILPMNILFVEQLCHFFFSFGLSFAVCLLISKLAKQGWMKTLFGVG